MGKTSEWAGIDEFVAVAQAKSFTAAARDLGYSSAHLSREINDLEDRLQQRLFFRTTRSLSLTDAGERFFAHCRGLIEARQEALAAMAEDRSDVSGFVRVTAPVAFGEKFIAPPLQQLMSIHSKLRVELVLNNEYLDLVDRSIDLAIRVGALTDSRMVSLRLSAISVHLAATPEYLREHGAPESLDHLAQHKCVAVTRQPWTFVRDGKPLTYRPVSVFSSNNGYAVLDGVLAGLGIGQVPSFHAAPHLASGRLVEILSEHRPAATPVWGIYMNRRHLPQRVRAVLSHLQKAFQAVDAKS